MEESDIEVIKVEQRAVIRFFVCQGKLVKQTLIFTGLPGTVNYVSL